MHRTLTAGAFLFVIVTASADEPIKTDRYGDPLPRGAVARLGTVRFRHSLPIDSIVYSADGKLLASGSWDGTACVWESATGKLQARIVLSKSNGPIRVALSPNGRMLATADSGISLWDATTGRLIRKLDGHPRQRNKSYWAAAAPLAFTPDGRTLAVGGLGSVVTWDVDTGKRRHTFTEDEMAAGAFALSSDGKRLALRAVIPGLQGTTYDAILQYDLDTGKEVRRYHDPGFGWGNIALSPDGESLAVVLQPEGMARHGNGRILVRETASGAEISRISASAQLDFVAFSPDGKHLATIDDRGIAFWDAATGKEIRSLERSAGAACLAFAPDGKTLAAGCYHAIRFWNVATGKEIPGPPGHDGAISSLAFVDGGKSVMIAGGRTLCRWTTATGEQTGDFQKLLTTALPSKPLPWYIEDFPRHLPFRPEITVSPNSQSIVVFSERDYKAYLWDIRTCEKRTEFEFSGTRVFTISADGRSFAWSVSSFGAGHTNGESFQLVRDLATGKETSSPERPARLEILIALSADGARLATWSSRRQLHCWDVKQWKELWTVRDEGGWPLRGSFSPDGSLLAAFSHNGSLTTTVDDSGVIRLLDATTGKLVRKLEGHQKAVQAIAFSPDGKRLGSGDSTGIIRIWDVTTHKEILKLDANSGVSALAFSPDGKILASGHWDTTALVWDLEQLQKASKAQ